MFDCYARSSDSGLPGAAIVTIDEGEDEEVEGNESAEGNRASSRVRFAALPVVVEIPAASAPGSADVSENDVVFRNEDSTSQPAAVMRQVSLAKPPLSSSSKRRANDEDEEVDEEEEDDDW